MFKTIDYLLWGILAGTLVNAQNSTAKGYSVFASGRDNSNVTFAINIPSSSEDIYYHLEGPIQNSWLAVGFGDRMNDSLIFIIYKRDNGKNITISTRTANGNFEPSVDHDRNVQHSRLFTDNGRYVAKWKCSNCRTWKRGSINVNATAQPMIYAVGRPNIQLDSSDVNAGLRRHDWFGRFTINLQQAQGGFDLFQPSFKSSGTDGASVVGASTDDHDFGSPAHAIFMAGTFVILFPLGGVWLRIFKSVRLHWMTQVLGVLVVFFGAGIGISLSKQFNRARNYSSVHQIIGFTVLFLLLLQFGLGVAHHAAYKKNPKPTILSKIHGILGPLIICVGVVNGALGFKFASVPRHIIGYAILSLIVTGILVVTIIIHDRRRRRKAVFETPALQNFQNAYVAPEYQADIPLGHTEAPPPYSRPWG